MPGYGTSLGLPDAGLATVTEMALNAKMMASAVCVSVIAATNMGDSNAMDTVRCAEEFIRLGGSAAVIWLED
ncbi:MAG: Carboxyvinyl-carboxyphosphonate phosphorylmutase [Rubritepida sp.]|nr:Carboxyvinyl-carboxyphosphonate phosphorylmutase [Rubritepida sp.]